MKKFLKRLLVFIFIFSLIIPKNSFATNDDDWFEEDDSPNIGHEKIIDKKENYDDEIIDDLFGDESTKESPKKEDEKRDTKENENDDIDDLFGDGSTKENPKNEDIKKDEEDKSDDVSETEDDEEKETLQNFEQWDVKNFVIEDDTVYGFSSEGIEKLKTDGNLVLPSKKGDKNITKIASFAFHPKKNEEIPNYIDRDEINGEKTSKDVDGNEIKNLGFAFNDTLLKSVTIPEGYKFIGQDAFVYNKNLSKINFAKTIEKISDYAFAHISVNGSIKLPDSLKNLGDSAFMDSTISGKLILPENLEDLGERTFKGNLISDVEFKGEKINKIGEKVFEDNKIEKMNIPDSIKEIASDAFNGNYGDENYGYIVTLWTKGKNNKNNLAGASFYVDPKEDKKVQKPDINYKIWESKDFNYNEKGNEVTGFSEIGKLKVRKNKSLEIPNENNGIKITEIGKDAFRNVDFGNETLKKYDLVSVKLPKNIEKIGDFAFQSNYIKELDVQDNENLIYIGKGAFMNNKIEMLSLNDNLKVIDDAAFHINNINMVLLPKNVEKVGFSAFRENKIENLLSNSEKLIEIGEMAFLGNAIGNLDLSEIKNLKIIGVQAFAGNLISEIKFPQSIEKIREEAFRKNNLQKLTLPNTVKKIAFNAFDENKGDEALKKVIVELSGENINKIPDGENFIVNLNEFTKDKSDIEKTLKRIEELNLDSLQDDTKKLFLQIKDEGKKLLEKENLRKGESLRYVFETDFILDRANIDVLIKKAKEALKNSKDENKNKLLKSKVEYAKANYANSALTNRKVKRLEKELKFLTDLVNNEGEISSATMIQGKHELKSPLPIPSYWIGVNVYFDKEGKILYVLDMSYTIGEDQKSEYGVAIENVDEDNAGYHQLAIDTLEDYEGISYKDILSKTVDTVGNIIPVEKAKYHREGIYNAVKDACSDYKKTGKDLEKIESENDTEKSKDENFEQDGNLDYTKNPSDNRRQIYSKDKRGLKKTNLNSNVLGFVAVAVVSLGVLLIINKKRTDK